MMMRMTRIKVVGIASSQILAVSLAILALTVPVQMSSAAVWGTELEISIDATFEDQANPSIIADGSNVHVVWADIGDGNWDIYYRFFDGAIWQPEQEVSMGGPGESQTDPEMAMDGDELHLVWRDSRGPGTNIYYRNFDGTNWQAELQLNSNPGGDSFQRPEIAAANGKVHVVWDGGPGGDTDVFYRHFDGTSWQSQIELSSDAGTESQRHATVTADGNTVHAAWVDLEDGDFDVYYRFHDGVGWQSEFEISADGANEDQNVPAIAASGGKVHVVWEDYGDGDSDIYYRFFNGTVWQGEMELSSDSVADEQYSPYIVADGDRLHATWFDGKGGDFDIVYRYFDGTAWHPEEEVSTDSAGERQMQPDLDVSGSFIQMAWADEEGGDMDILYRRGIEDIVPPSSGAAVDQYWHTGALDVNWTATDDYDLKNVSCSYRYSSDNATWSAWQEWGFDGALTGTSASGTFPFTPTSDGHYEFHCMAGDAAGNMETVPVVAEALAGADTAPPTGTILINDGDEWTTSESVTLTLTYSDATSGVSDIRFSNDGTWDTELWEPPSATKSWALTSGEGTKTVYYQVRDFAGHESTTYSDDIELDATAPTVESVSPLDGATDVGVTTSVIVTFSEAMDESDTEDSFSLRMDSTDVIGTFSWSGNSRTMTFTPTNDLEESTTYQVIVSTVAEDAAGNHLDSAEQTSFTTEGEAADGAAVDDWWVLPLIALLIIIIIVVVILALVLRSRRAPPQAEPLPPEPEAPPGWQDEAPPAPPEPP